MISEPNNFPPPCSPPASAGLRLLVLGQRDATLEPWWPEVWDATACVFASDLYGALVELVQARTAFDAVVIDARRLTPPMVRAVALIRQHRGMPVWLLDSGGRRDLVAQAVAAGAGHAGEEPVKPAAKSGAMAPPPLPTPAAPLSQTIAAGPAVHAEKTTIRDFTESKRDAVESDPAVTYHDNTLRDTLQPVLTEEELRALLGPEP